MLVPKPQLDDFLSKHGGLPQQGIDVVMMVDTKVGAREASAVPIVCFPGVTQIDSLDERVYTISTIALGYLRPSSFDNIKMRTFAHR